MSPMHSALEGLTTDQLARFADALNEAFLWRGWDRHGGVMPESQCRCHACEFISQAEAIFSENGREFEEYT